MKNSKIYSKLRELSLKYANKGLIIDFEFNRYAMILRGWLNLSSTNYDVYRYNHAYTYEMIESLSDEIDIETLVDEFKEEVFRGYRLSEKKAEEERSSEELDFVQPHKKIPVTLDLTPCDNAVSRQAAVEAFQMFREYESNRSNKEWVNRIETVLNQLPPVNPTKIEHWIPVSERFPEEDKTVIASTKYGVYPEARYTEENGWEWAYESGADYWEEIKDDVEAWMPLPKRYKPHESGDTEMTYGNIYNEFLKKFPNVEVEDYRPAVEMHIPQLSRGIPNAIIVWLKDGSKVIYITESEE